MQQRARERIYLLITVFSLIMCAFLLVSVFLDIPIASVSHTREVYVPFMPANTEVVAAENDAPAQTERGLEITGDYLARQMAAFVPKGFPVSGIKVDILSGGGFGLGLEIKKLALKGYLEQSGVKLGLRQSIALGLLPEKLGIEAVLMCTHTNTAGASLELDSLSVNGKSVNTDFLPPSIFEVLAGAINASLAYNGIEWSNVVFTDGALYYSN